MKCKESNVPFTKAYGLIADIPWVSISREHTNMTGYTIITYRQIRPRQIGPLANLVAKWTPHFLGPSLPLFGKLGPWKMLVWQIGPRQIGPQQIGPRQIWPLYHKYICIRYTAKD